ncbi:hypothetical protein L288_09980 [Sphingobium quisquiliarum P25]|uniref:Uncharacterized protein n=1 Tax=Sphingobium quisquiliarum P25 TaxID=1329909 RepID=T0ICT6_9SPHN|nr:hypothetical protein L288_09980 [Sphingobium quisquiliarum P25]
MTTEITEDDIARLVGAAFVSGPDKNLVLGSIFND